MLKFRQNAAAVLRQISRGERFVLTHRGKPVARLEPPGTDSPADPSRDPFLNIARRAVPSPRGKTRHQDIDRILYAGK